MRGIASSGQTQVGGAIGRQIFKGMALALPIFVVGQRHILVVAAILLVDDQHFVHLRHCQRVQNQPVQNAEDGFIGADPDGQGEHRRQRETRRLAQLAHGVTQVLK